jgi:hypothetical protein
VLQNNLLGVTHYQLRNHQQSFSTTDTWICQRIQPPADSRIVNENSVVADLEISNKNCVAADSEFSNENCVTANSEIDRDDGVVFVFTFFC